MALPHDSMNVLSSSVDPDFTVGAAGLFIIPSEPDPAGSDKPHTKNNGSRADNNTIAPTAMYVRAVEGMCVYLPSQHLTYTPYNGIV